MPARLRSKGVVGVISGYTGPGILDSTYFAGCIGGIFDAANAAGWDVHAFVSRDYNHDEPLHPRHLREVVDGVILVGPPMDSAMRRILTEESFPFIVISSRMAESTWVAVDNAQGIDLAIEHLVSLGHTSIGHLHGPLDQADAIERLQAFRLGMLRRQLPVDEEHIQFGGFQEDTGYEGMGKVIWGSERPSAVICANDIAAIGAIRASWENGLRCPADMSIVGFDGTQLCEASLPKLTSVRQPWAEMGARAFEKLVARLKEMSPESEVLACELLVRFSTSRPGMDPILGLAAR